MSCKCHGAANATGSIVDLSTVSLMPRYAPAPGLGDLSTGTAIMATIGWIAVGGVCGAALWVAGKELLKS